MTRPMLVRFLSRLQLLTRLSPFIAAENIPRAIFLRLTFAHDPTQGGRGPRLHGYCRLMALRQSLSDVMVVALSPQTVPMQGEYVP